MSWLPYIDDLGDPGSWADAIAHSPCLKVSDYVGRQLPDGADSVARLSLHSTTNSSEGEHNHGA